MPRPARPEPRPPRPEPRPARPEPRPARPEPRPAPAQVAAATGVQTVTVTPDEAGLRVDRFLEARFPGLSFSHIQRIIRKGELRVNGKRTAPKDRLAAGQAVRIPPLSLEPRPVRAAGPTSVCGRMNFRPSGVVTSKFLPSPARDGSAMPGTWLDWPDAVLRPTGSDGSFQPGPEPNHEPLTVCPAGVSPAPAPEPGPATLPCGGTSMP